MQAIGIQVEPRIDCCSRRFEQGGGVAITAIDQNASFNMKRRNTGAGQIRRTNVRCLAAILPTHMERFWVVVSIPVADDAKECLFARNP
jgi:hypothetical protein